VFKSTEWTFEHITTTQQPPLPTSPASPRQYVPIVFFGVKFKVIAIPSQQSCPSTLEFSRGDSVSDRFFREGVNLIDEGLRGELKRTTKELDYFVGKVDVFLLVGAPIPSC